MERMGLSIKLPSLSLVAFLVTSCGGNPLGAGASVDSNFHPGYKQKTPAVDESIPVVGQVSFATATTTTVNTVDPLAPTVSQVSGLGTDLNRNGGAETPSGATLSSTGAMALDPD